MSCPMNCPKNLRNGPCGGVRADGHCEVKPEMACVWIEAFHGSARIRGRAVALQTVQSPVDWRGHGRSAWLAQAREKAESREALNFDDIPDDPSQPMPILPGHVSAGRLERVLRAGVFAVTSEMDPPDSADPEEVFARARIFDGYVDAINATDGAGAHCHMSSVAVSALLIRAG